MLRTANGAAKLADFGIARVAKDSEVRVSGHETSGTLVYMSPEQLMGEQCDSRSDLYSLAASLYELLSGKPPFHTGSIQTQIQFKPASPIADCSETVNAALLKGLAKEPEGRQTKCVVFAENLAAELTRPDSVCAAKSKLPKGSALASGDLSPRSQEPGADRLDAFERRRFVRVRLGRTVSLAATCGILLLSLVCTAFKFENNDIVEIGIWFTFALPFVVTMAYPKLRYVSITTLVSFVLTLLLGRRFHLAYGPHELPSHWFYEVLVGWSLSLAGLVMLWPSLIIQRKMGWWPKKQKLNLSGQSRTGNPQSGPF
jgi:serine/threonine protein kinase